MSQLLPILNMVGLIAAALVLLYVAATDIYERRIPNRVMFPALACALALALLQPERWSLLLGGVLAGGVLLLPAVLYGLEKAGGGDVKLALFLGLVLGWPHIFLALVLAFSSALLFSIGGLMLGRLSRHSLIAFGPFLSFGGLVAGIVSLGSLVG
jgi:Flp pilus assembly protein protease CpaA